MANLNPTWKPLGLSEDGNTAILEQFKKDVQRVYEKKNQCLVAVSEGISNKDGDFISSSSALKDAFGSFTLNFIFCSFL